MFYIDKTNLNHWTGIFGEKNTYWGVPQPTNRMVSRYQMMPGTKCTWKKEGGKDAWEVPSLYIDPKNFDFAGINRPTIHDR